MILSLETYLKDRIIGQDEVIEEYCGLIDRATNGFHYSDVPIANVLFLGPTGVGKTDLALLTCDYLFRHEVDKPREERLARFDMAEYNTPAGIHKLLGGPDQPSIFDILYQKTDGKGIILWDELEKGYTLVLDSLLQILSAGRVTLVDGRVLDLKNYILIGTTNIGSRMLIDSRTTRRDKIKRRVEKVLQDTLRAEIIGRFNLLGYFNKLGEDSTYKIAEIHAQECLRISKDMGHHIILSEEAIDAIMREGYSETYGARPIKDAAMAIVGGAIRSKQIKKTDKICGTLTYDARTGSYDIK